MSDRATPPADPGETGRDHTGLDDLRSNPEIRGPVAPGDDHGHANGHVALIYETRAEQLATAIPFIRDGLERGERVMYIVDDLSRADLIAALRDADVDVDAALDSGQLSIHTVAETYRRDGAFNLDAARDLLTTAMEDAVAEYEGFRVTAEETWLVGDPAAQREFLTCEAHVNDLIDGEAALALCQYDRDALPPDVIEDVIETHPHLIIDGTVCANDYYTPPAEYFGPADTARENDRKMSTLVDRAEARAALRTRERYERDLYEIAADPDRGFDAKLDALFELGRERFGLDHGGVARLDPDTDRLEVRAITDDAPLDPGQQLPLSETHCRLLTDHTETVSVADATAAGLADTASYAEFGVDAYLGTRLPIANGRDGSLFFFSTEPRDEPFTDAERTFVHLMGQWVQYELEHRQRERELRERTEHLNALVETTPDCIKTVARDGTVLRMNPAGLELAGVDAEDEVVGECVYDWIAPEDRDRYRAFTERVCDGERDTLEFDIVRADGTRRHLRSHAAPLERPDGTTVKVAVTHDITERKRVEQQLEAERDMFAEGPAVVFRWESDADAGWPVEYVSENVEDVLGYTPAELESGEIPYTDLLLDEELDRIAHEVAEHSDDSTERFAHDPYRVRTKDGDVRWVKDITKIVRDDTGAIDHYLGYLVDITELQESEERLRLALEAGEMGTWELDLRTGESPVRSPQHDRIFGYEDPVDDWSYETFLDHVHPDDRERVEQRFEDALETGSWEFECWITGADGEHRAISAQGEFSYDSDGDPVRAVGVVQDITDRKRAEEQLQKSEERFRALVDASSDVVYRMSPDWNEMHELDGKEFLADTSKSTSEWVDKYILPDDWERVKDAIDEAIRTKSVFELEHRVEQDDGSIGWTHSRAVPMLDEDGEIEEWIGMASDITERKERKRQLEESERRYRTLAENFPNGGVGVYDEDLRYTLVTGTMWDDIEPDPQDLEGETIWECLPPDTVDDVEPLFRAALDGETGSVVSSLGGRTYRVWATPLRDADGEITGGQSFALDITDRLERERALRESRNQLQALFEVLPVGVVVADADGELVKTNDAAEAIWDGEHPDAESVAEYDQYDGWWADTDDPVQPEEWPVARALRGEAVTDPGAIEIETFDGDRRTVLIHGMPVRDADGEVDRAVGTIIDITEREERKQRLQEQNERLESFASMLAHELRNPVTIGQIYSQQLPERADTDAIDYVMEAFDRIENMIDVMLVLTRGRDAVDGRTPVALAEVTREAWADVDAPEAVFDAATDQTIQADETYIRHLFRNLFENAVEHGGADVTVEVGELPDGNGFYVADDGEGIPVEKRDRVFDEGFTTAGDNGGTGLGLAFVQKLAEVYEWDVTVTDSEEGGARFEFRDVV